MVACLEFSSLRDHVARTLISMGWRDRLLGGAEAARRERLRSLIAARRRMIDAPYRQSFDGIDLPDGGWMPTRRRRDASPVRRSGQPMGPKEEEFLADYVQETFDGHPSWGGFYGPAFNIVVYPADTAHSLRPRTIRRHEVMHGYNQAARDGVPGMPISSRLLATLPEGMARPLDEMIATRAGGERILEVPWDTYAETYRKQGNLQAARIAEALHAAQRAGRLASDNPMAAGATIGGGGTLLYGLMSGDDGQ